MAGSLREVVAAARAAWAALIAKWSDRSPVRTSNPRVWRFNMASTLVSIRYMIDDVAAAIAFYTNHLGFTLGTGHCAGVRFHHPWRFAVAAQRAEQLRSAPYA
jgi:hypothetical protein